MYWINSCLIQMPCDDYPLLDLSDSMFSPLGDISYYRISPVSSLSRMKEMGLTFFSSDDFLFPFLSPSHIFSIFFVSVQSFLFDSYSLMFGFWRSLNIWDCKPIFYIHLDTPDLQLHPLLFSGSSQGMMVEMRKTFFQMSPHPIYETVNYSGGKLGVAN